MDWPRFETLDELTPDEIAAVQAYTSYSALLHHRMQGRDGLNCQELIAKFRQTDDLMRQIASATRKYRLAEPATFYAGIGNGYAALGSLWANPPERLVGLAYRYGGFFSTSVDRAALRFLEAGSKFNSVFLTIDAAEGLLALPLWVIDPNNAIEGEALIAPQTRFAVAGAARAEAEGGTPIVELDLQYRTAE